MPDPGENRPIKQVVEQLSRAAYELAKAAVDEQETRDQRVARARELDQELDRLVAAIMAAAPAEQPALQEEWTNARMDLTYVLAGGGPTSLRLNQHIKGR